MEPVDSEQDQARYQQQWQEQLAHDMRERLALEQQQQEEEAQSYLYEINVGERTQLAARHQAERQALVQQHRTQRIALRKKQPR